MLFCYKCGEIVNDNAKQCQHCGALLQSGKESEPISPSITEKPNNSKKMINYLLIMTLSVFAITVIIFLFVIFTQGKKSTSKQTQNSSEAEQSSKDSTIKGVHDAMQEVTTAIFGKDDAIAKHLVVETIPSSATDVETAADYHYKKLQVPVLFTDLMQLGGYSMQKQLTEATTISIEKENEIGDKIEDALLKGAYKGKVNNDKTTAEYLDQLGKFLAKKVIRKGIKYKFYLLDDDHFNALSYPGGKIFIFTGLLKNLSNEAELAAILAHEIKHVDLRHTMALYQIAMKIQGVDNDPSQFIIFLESLAQHPYSGRIEADADRRGLELSYSCGYSPFQIVEFWRKLAGKNKKQKSEKPKNSFEAIINQAEKELSNILSSHPGGKTRYILLQNHTIKLLQKYPAERFYIGKWNFDHKIPMWQQQR